MHNAKKNFSLHGWLCSTMLPACQSRLKVSLVGTNNIEKSSQYSKRGEPTISSSQPKNQVNALSNYHFSKLSSSDTALSWIRFINFQLQKHQHCIENETSYSWWFETGFCSWVGSWERVLRVFCMHCVGLMHLSSIGQKRPTYNARLISNLRVINQFD